MVGIVVDVVYIRICLVDVCGFVVLRACERVSEVYLPDVVFYSR